jgi:putative sterol carrier protein
MTPKSFFEETLKSALASDPKCLAQSQVAGQAIAIDVSGTDGGQWTLSFDGLGQCSLTVGATQGAQCKIESNDKTFAGVIDGSTNVAFAYMMRKIKVQGDSGLAIKVGMALKSAFLK